MKYNIKYRPEAIKDLSELDNSVRLIVKKAIENAADAPLPKAEGGKGKPLGNKYGINLTNFLELKLKRSGIRIIYKLERSEQVMNIIVIGARSDFEVFITAKNRIDKYETQPYPQK
jgi:mRNA interferase RelE/StbE